MMKLRAKQFKADIDLPPDDDQGMFGACILLQRENR
jgi:hypothetical protein